jgi:hypothetical protein
MEFGPEILIRLLPAPQPVYHDIQLVRGGENERGRGLVGATLLSPPLLRFAM